MVRLAAAAMLGDGIFGRSRRELRARERSGAAAPLPGVVRAAAGGSHGRAALVLVISGRAPRRLVETDPSARRRAARGPPRHVRVLVERLDSLRRGNPALEHALDRTVHHLVPVRARTAERLAPAQRLFLAVPDRPAHILLQLADAVLASPTPRLSARTARRRPSGSSPRAACAAPPAARARCRRGSARALRR